jgi:non-heme chloroperoxidase
MSTITTKDGMNMYYKDWGTGQPVVFCHGWPLTSDAFEDQMFFLASNGYRCIAMDRRGHGRSDQTWHGNDMDTYAADMSELIEKLDLRDAILVGHSTGGGVVAHYIGQYGTKRVAKAVLISAVPPGLIKSDSNPDGLPNALFDSLRDGIQKDRAQFWNEFRNLFYGLNRPGAKISEGVADSFWLQCTMTGFPGSYLGIKAFSETDFNEDLKKFDIPTLILHGEDDQVVPVGITAHRTAKIVKDAVLKVYPGYPHGMPQTHKDVINADLLEFIQKAQVTTATSA